MNAQPFFFRIKDGARGQVHDARQDERNDCAVNAIARVTDSSYDAAYRFCASKGRKPNRGMYTSQALGKYCEPRLILGRWFRHLPGRRQTVKTFCREHPKGVYLIRVRKHVLALYAGDVFDTRNWMPRSIVLDAWKVTIDQPADMSKSVMKLGPTAAIKL